MTFSPTKALKKLKNLTRSVWTKNKLDLTWSYGRHRDDPMTNKLSSFFKGGDPQRGQSRKDHLPDSFSQFSPDEPPTAAIITVLSDSPFWRQLAPRPTLGWWHYCSGRSWSSVLFFWCLQEVRTFLPLHIRPPAARSETGLKSPDTQI